MPPRASEVDGRRVASTTLILRTGTGMPLARKLLELSCCHAVRAKTSSMPSADVDVRRVTALRRRCFRCDVTLGVSRLLSGYCARPPGRKSAENPAAVEVKFDGFSDVRRAGRGKFEEREPTTAKRRAKIEDRESKFVDRKSKSEDRERTSEDGS